MRGPGPGCGIPAAKAIAGFAWPVPLAIGDDSAQFPRVRDQTGLSRIAMGHSGADPFMEYCPFAFFRLYVKTGVAHYLTYARFLSHNTKQVMDWDSDHPLGYAIPGLQTEAGAVCSPRGHYGDSFRKNDWLPWVTVDGLTPLAQLEDVYGSMDVDTLASKSWESLRTRDEAFARTESYGPDPDAIRASPVIPSASSLKRSRDALGRLHASGSQKATRVSVQISYPSNSQ